VPPTINQKADCASCPFYRDEDTVGGKCVASPPTVHIITDEDSEYLPITVFPYVLAKESCGRHPEFFHEAKEDPGFMGT
jgi:hypothetical protein